MPGGGLHLASSEAGRRDGLLRRNLRYILTAIVAVVASVALAVPSVYADPANNAVEEPAQTTAAASDVDPLADGGDNSWQIVKCSSKSEEGCTTESDDKNVRVHKWVTSTGKENVFDVHLSIDKKPDLSDQVLNGDMYLMNNNSVKVTESGTLKGQTDANGAPVYFMLQFFDDNGNKIAELMRTCPNIDEGSIDGILLFPKGTPVVYKQTVGLSIFRGNQAPGSGKQDDPYIVDIHTNWPGFGDVFGNENTSVSLNQVTDVMGANIAYKGSLSGDYDVSHTSWDESNNTLTWAPAEKQDVEVGDDGWLNNVAEISYRVELVNFKSSGLKDQHLTPEHSYDTNSSATLSYEVSKTINGTPSGDPTQGTVEFETPVVRGLLYDIVATKNDGDGEVLPGAEFGLYDTDNNMLGGDGSVVTDESQQYTATSDEDGSIVFENLPHGTYVVKEITAPDGYTKTEETWTVYLCYTRDEVQTMALMQSSKNPLNAMVTDPKSFINVPATEPVTMKVAKKLDGRGGMSGDKFTFTLTPKSENAPMPAGENGTTLTSLTTTIDMSTAKDGESRTNEFQEIPIPVDKAGTYEYTITESGESKVLGLNYSKAEYTVTVTVNADGDVSVGYTPVLDDQGESVQDPASPAVVPVFTNTLKRLSTSPGHPVSKSIDGRAWKSGDKFTFRVKALDPETGKPALSAPAPVNAAGGNVEDGWLVVLDYDQAKELQQCETDEAGFGSCGMFIHFDVPYPDSEFTYAYVVSEVVPDNPEPGMVYSQAQWVFYLEAYPTADGMGLHTWGAASWWTTTEIKRSFPPIMCSFLCVS